MPVDVGSFCLLWRDVKGRVHKGIQRIMHDLFRTRNGRFINTRHEMVSEQFKTMLWTIPRKSFKKEMYWGLAWNHCYHRWTCEGKSVVKNIPAKRLGFNSKTIHTWCWWYSLNPGAFHNEYWKTNTIVWLLGHKVPAEPSAWITPLLLTICINMRPRASLKHLNSKQDLC